jgi:hypothetical protein
MFRQRGYITRFDSGFYIVKTLRLTVANNQSHHNDEGGDGFEDRFILLLILL